MPKLSAVTLLKEGSKRLPGKNTRPLGGVPLYQWTVATGLALGIPYHVYHNYEKLELPAGVIEHRYTGDGMTMDRLSELDADVFVMLPVTSPFRDTTQIRDTVKAFCRDALALVMLPVVKCPTGRYYNAIKEPVNCGAAYYSPRDVLFRECGSLFIFRSCQLGKPHIMDCEAEEKRMFIDPVGIDIDTEDDFRGAERWLTSRCSL